MVRNKMNAIALLLLQLSAGTACNRFSSGISSSSIDRLFKELAITPKAVWLVDADRNRNDTTEFLADSAPGHNRLELIGNLNIKKGTHLRRALSGWSDKNYLRKQDFSLSGSSVSIGCWIYLKGPQPPMATIMDNKHSGTSGLLFSVVKGNRVQLHIGNGDFSKAIVSKTPLTYNAWHFITAVNDGINLYIFIDGRFTDISLSTNVNVSVEKGLTIGQWCGVFGRGLRADTLLQEVFVVEQPLTLSQIEYLYHGR
ncbi:MAG: LamG-like jellyroll fold domain-containing protein [bacterium]